MIWGVIEAYWDKWELSLEIDGWDLVTLVMKREEVGMDPFVCEEAAIGSFLPVPVTKVVLLPSG